MMIPISEDINTEGGTRNNEPGSPCIRVLFSWSGLWRSPAVRRTDGGAVCGHPAAQAVADYFTAVELAPEHLSCVMEDLCYAVRTLPRPFTYAELSGLHAPD